LSSIAASALASGWSKDRRYTILAEDCSQASCSVQVIRIETFAKQAPRRTTAEGYVFTALAGVDSVSIPDD
jgi:hypothetical protein